MMVDILLWIGIISFGLAIILGLIKFLCDLKHCDTYDNTGITKWTRDKP